MATVAETPVMFAAFNNQKIDIVGTIAETDDNTKIIARKDQGILSPDDISGKKLAVSFGTVSEYFADLFLDKYGIDLSKVKMVNLDAPNMPIALINGDIDAFTIWEPYVYNAKKSLGAKAIIFEEKGLYTMPWNLVSIDNYAKENPNIVEKMLRVMIKANEFINKNREEAVQITAKHIGMNPEDLNNIWDYYSFSTKLDEPFLVTILEKEAKWAIKTGLVPKGTAIPDYHSVIYSSILKKVTPKAVIGY